MSKNFPENGDRRFGPERKIDHRLCVNCGELLRSTRCWRCLPFGTFNGDKRMWHPVRDAKVATIIECDEELGGAHPAMTYFVGWGYRDEATGVVYTGSRDGDHWSDSEAEIHATEAGYWIKEKGTP